MATNTSVPAGLSTRGFKAPRPLSERLVAGLLFFCAAVSILTTVGIVVVLFGETAAFFDSHSLADVLGDTNPEKDGFQSDWRPQVNGQKSFGIWPLVSGTLQVTLISLTVALPFGLLIAVYLSEYARPKTRRRIKPVIEVLAGVPTVVYGFFALTVVTEALRATFGTDVIGQFNALSAGLVMGVMIIPTIASLSEDAIYAVPLSLREAGYALGATKRRTIFRVVLPAASSGIIAAVILGISRAVGETMIVTIAAGQSPVSGIDPTQAIMTMTAAIVQIFSGDAPHGTDAYRAAFVVGTSLFMMTLTLNVGAYFLRKRYRKGGA